MLSQFAAVECNVLIQAGLGSLSRLCFLQHKGKLEGEWVQAFGATISGILIGLDKGYL